MPSIDYLSNLSIIRNVDKRVEREDKFIEEYDEFINVSNFEDVELYFRKVAQEFYSRGYEKGYKKAKKEKTG